MKKTSCSKGGKKCRNSQDLLPGVSCRDAPLSCTFLCNRDPDLVPRPHSTRFQPQRCFTAPCPRCTCDPSQLWLPISQGSLAETKLGQNQGWCLWSICIQSTEPQTCEKWLSLVKECLIYRGVCLLRGHTGGWKSKALTAIRKCPQEVSEGENRDCNDGRR